VLGLNTQFSLTLVLSEQEMAINFRNFYDCCTDFKAQRSTFVLTFPFLSVAGLSLRFFDQ